MQFKDYYEVLGVGRDADDEAIKRAYRKLARKYHPDVSKEADAEARFKELGEAYEVLRDAEKRAAYDRLGARYRGGQDFQPPPDWGSGFEFSGAPGGGADFSDFFESLFGRRAHAAAAAPSTDHHARIAIDLEDAFNGAQRQVTLQSPQAGADGRVRMVERSLSLRIPRGVREGQRLRLSGQGAPGHDGRRGDLYLEIQFKPHPWYRVVDGRDLQLSLPVAPWEAALGATVVAPTPGGRVELAIPPGAQSGRRLRLKGRGLPGDPPGDLYVELKVVLPPADSDAARALYRRMADEMRFQPRAQYGV